MKLNLLILAMAMSGLFTLQSCEKEVPEVDTEQPSLSVTIRGPGITRTVTDLDADRYQFNLAYGVEYDLIISIGDTGGCKELHAQVFQDMNPTDFTSLISGREVTRRDLGISTYFDLINTTNTARPGYIVQCLCVWQRLRWAGWPTQPKQPFA
jgi:hypothetical protein